VFLTILTAVHISRDSDKGDLLCLSDLLMCHHHHHHHQLISSRHKSYKNFRAAVLSVIIVVMVVKVIAVCLHCRDNEDDDVCLPERRRSSGQRFRPLMTLKQRRRSLLSASSLPIQIPNRPNGSGSDGQLQQDSGISPSPVGRWKRALRQVRTLSDPWAKFELESLPTEKAKRYRYSALKKKWVTDEVSVKMESEVCCYHSQLRSCITLSDCFLILLLAVIY